MNEKYLALTMAYHNALTESQAVENEIKSLREAFEDEISAKRDIAKQLSEKTAEAKKALGEYALKAHEDGTLEPGGSVQIKQMPEYIIDDEKALAWARVNFPVAVVESVNKKLLKPLLEDKDAKYDWGSYKRVATPYVASNLSKYLE